MENKIVLKFLLGLIINLSLLDIVYSSDILFHEQTGGETIIYKVSPDGTGLRKIGNGFSPQWSPDNKFITYIDPKTFGEFVFKDSGGKESFRIKEKELENVGSIIQYAWNPKSESIAFVSVYGRHKGVVSCFNLKTKKIKPLHKIEFDDLDVAIISTTLEWSSDGELLLFSKEQGITLIDSKNETVTKILDIGTLPRFIEKDRILFIIGSEIWTINIDGSNKKKLFDTGTSVMNTSKVVNKKILLQLEVKNLFGELPSKMLLLDLSNNRAKEVTLGKYLFLCPNIAPDGIKFTSFGMKLKNGELVSGQYVESGYYVFDLETEKVTVLKKSEAYKNGGFWSGIYLNCGSHPSWN